jgi:hypothetical protein
MDVDWWSIGLVVTIEATLVIYILMDNTLWQW